MAPLYTCDNISLNLFQNEKYFRQKLYRKSKHLENPAVCEIMCKNTVERDRPRTIWRMRIACWILKAITHTQNM